MTINDTITLDWDNEDYDGDELLEIFQRLNTGPGPWAKVKTIAHNNAAAQSQAVDGLIALTEYDFAIRSQRGGLYRPGWGAINPELWDDAGLEAGARVEAVPTGAVAPGINVCEWSRTTNVSHRISIGFPSDANDDAPPEGCTVEVERGLDGIDFDPLDETAADATDYQDLLTNPEVGVRYYYRLRYKRGSLVGAWSDVVSAWAGPLAPNFSSVYYSVRNGTGDGIVFYDEWGFVFTWPAGDYDGVQVVEVEVDEGGGFNLSPPSNTADNWTRPTGGLVLIQVDAFQFCGLGPLDSRIRIKQTYVGVDDYSEYVTEVGGIACDL